MSEPVAIGKVAPAAASKLADTKLDDNDRLVTSRCSDCRTLIKVPKWVLELGKRFHEVLINKGEQGMTGAGRCDPCGTKWEVEQYTKAEALASLTAYTWQRLNKLRREYRSGDVDSTFIAGELKSLPDDFIAVEAVQLEVYRQSLREIWKRHQERGAAVDTDLG